MFFDDFKVTHSKSPVISTSDYYALGMQFNNFEKENSVEQKYLYNGKEFEEETGWYNYGARMLDPAIGRWNGIDPYSDVYEDLSPYNYALNNPIRVIDSDGQLVVYVNGFRLAAYRSYFRQATSPILQVSNNAVPPWEHEQWLFDKDQYQYWNGFNIGIGSSSEARLYVDGMFHPQSIGGDRFSRGEREGRLLAEKIKSGEITLEDGETIKLVGHSHGGAHAMGMAQGLLDAGIDASLINVLLFAPHQPNQIPGVDVKVYQFSREDDKVSSKGILSKLFGGSKFAWVEGAEGTQAPDGDDDGLGNHGIQTYTTDEVKAQNPELYQWLIDQGIINDDGSLNNNQ